MSTDFQVVFPSTLVDLRRIRLTPPSPLGLPRSLDIVGDDFRAVDEVIINDLPSPDLIILSKTRLIAQLPDILQESLNVSNVKVISRKLVFGQNSVLRFRVSDQPSRVRGILRLVQLFVKILLTTPGTDIFNRSTGGGALRNIGQDFGVEQSGGIVSDLVIAVNNTSRQIISSQSRDPSLPRDERLLSAKVTKAGFNRELGGIISAIELTSQAGRSAITNLEL